MTSKVLFFCHMLYTTLASSFTDFSNMIEDTAAGLDIISLRNRGREVLTGNKKSVIQIEW